MIGYRPNPVIKYCWLFFTPATCFVSCTFTHEYTYFCSTEERPLVVSTVFASQSVIPVQSVLTISFLFVLPGNICLCLNQVFTFEVQQRVCVPMVGQWDRLDPGPGLHDVHSRLGRHEAAFHPRNTERGMLNLNMILIHGNMEDHRASMEDLC